MINKRNHKMYTNLCSMEKCIHSISRTLLFRIDLKVVVLNQAFVVWCRQSLAEELRIDRNNGEKGVGRMYIIPLV